MVSVPSQSHETGRLDAALSFAWRMMRYAIAGGSAFLTHITVLHVLVRYAGVDPVLASALGFLCSLPVNFVIQQVFVFRVSCHPLRRALRYLTVTAFTGILNVVLFWIAVDVLAVHYLLAQIFVTGIIALVNFLANMLYTFGEVSAGAPVEETSGS